ncbi:unnamed protein product [Cylicocyclus nassatus]|uniref:Uncharacterized protein n=1 Tax=Cylicocyclus nassatus TaxID=53992 RepID=A0AA36MHB9_CYLNA|nr:unnamed protein product [Cylicocyclus nassatus]
MRSFMGALFASLLIVLIALTVQEPIESIYDTDRFVASGPVSYANFQKKWSRLEPSIRFFKRTPQSLYGYEK